MVDQPLLILPSLEMTPAPFSSLRGGDPRPLSPEHDYRVCIANEIISKDAGVEVDPLGDLDTETERKLGTELSSTSCTAAHYRLGRSTQCRALRIPYTTSRLTSSFKLLPEPNHDLLMLEVVQQRRRSDLIMQSIGFLGPAFFLTQLCKVKTPAMAALCMACIQVFSLTALKSACTSSTTG
ncbi:hypothetical protein LINPERHAP1_LOCUS21615 [Linum perenne]